MLHLVAGEVSYYTVEDAARMLRLSPQRVREMLEQGELVGTRTGDIGGWRSPYATTLSAYFVAPSCASH